MKKKKIPIPSFFIGTGKGKQDVKGEERIGLICYYFTTDKKYRDSWRELLPADILQRAEASYLAHKERHRQKTKFNPEYTAYLNSTEWKQFRKYILSIRNCCEMCGDGSRELHIHHKTYENFMHEYEDDVQVLCYKCHEDVHGRKFALRRN